MNDDTDVEMAARGGVIPSALNLDLKNKHTVDWNGEDDSDCPRNWSLRRKWENLAIVAFLAFLT